MLNKTDEYHCIGEAESISFICVCSGGKVFGPRGPKTYFFMLPRAMRVLGLRAALSVKFAQVFDIINY
jgi:ribosomal protein L4